MLAEYIQPAPVLKNGRMVEVPAHSEPDELEFKAPIGRVKAGTVIHSETATLPGYLKDKGLKTCFFKIVYPEIVKKQLALLCGMGFARNEPVKLNGCSVSPIRMLSAMAPPPPFIEPADFEVLRVTLTGARQGRPLSLTWDCEMRHTKLLTAGAMGVGFAGAIASLLCAEGKVKTAGAGAPESSLDEEAFFAELKRRPVFSLHETISHPLTV
jgi:saccharopine dehydrogenase-like NADP-dependent oxidoreductase